MEGKLKSMLGYITQPLTYVVFSQEILRGLKKELKKKKETNPMQENSRLSGDCLVLVYQFLTSNPNFKITLNFHNFF